MNSKSLYIHIPFCRSKCAYCDFFSIGGKTAVPDAYLDSLIRELYFYKERYAIDCFHTIYIGGGTPSLLSPAQLTRLLQEASCCPLHPKEITVEMNPESLSGDLLKAFADSPAERRRLSLGIQSLNESALASVERHCKAEESRKALDFVTKYWKDDICLDLIAGLPCQTHEEFISSLTECLSCKPHHIPLYSLTIEEGTPLYRSIKNMNWDSDEADEQWITGKDLLESAGFFQYEVSNFCRKAHESLHNMAYWKQEDYIGIGSGATGSIYAFSGEGGIRWTNTKDLSRYIDFWQSRGKAAPKSFGEEIPRETERLTLEIEEEEFLMMGLRSSCGINSGEYRRRFSSLKPWNGRLDQRLGVHGGAWEQFSSQAGLARDCRIRKAGGEDSYFFTGKALSFLNTFLRHLT